MPNPNTPRGLIPYAFMSGAPYNGAMRTYYVPAGNATALYIGDPIALITNSSDGNGVQAVGIAAAGSSNLVLGSFGGRSNNAGFATLPILQSDAVYLPAGRASYVYVTDDPNLLYEVQEDGAMVSGASGRNANLVAGAGSTFSGYSGWQLQSSSLNTTNTLQLRIIEFLQQADNAIGANGKWLTKINQHQLTAQLGT